MKIIHTSDWHLGQTFYGYERKEEHQVFLAWLLRKLSDEAADVLLIAGDVFDSPNPSAESQSMYYRFLRRAAAENPLLTIIVTAGNHDSAARLEAPSPLLEEMRVHTRGIVQRNSGGEINLDRLIIPLQKDGETKAWCLAVPYLRQGDYPPSVNYSEGVAKLYRALLDAVPDPKLPVIAMGHLHATGAELSVDDQSERTIIGGLESVSQEAFPSEITYVALGHLHRAQRVSGRDNVRYAGAPVPMSFAERNNRQGVNVVEIGEVEGVGRLEFDPPARLISLPRDPGPLQSVIDELAALPDGDITAFSPYVEVKVKITEPEPSLRFRIEEALKGKAVRLAGIKAELPPKEKSAGEASFDDIKKIEPLEVALDVYRRKYGGSEMPQAMKDLLLIAIREAQQ
ncbi:MAG: exonuclease SbcCD subunit D C-terminal domain-containing protein [Tannerellaceae bacterium]|nr:exonuclease SbcCD subunit D C-terminal domain-containing protein [Tannerellaceae bacterium]